MSRHLRALAVSIASVSVILVACTRSSNGVCNVDLDCPPGSFCRGSVCAAVSGDAGADSDVPGICAPVGASCNVDGDCCTPPCNAFRCASGGGSSGKGSSGTSGTSGSSGTSGTSGSTCGAIYTLCSADFDCCTGLTCTNGSCL